MYLVGCPYYLYQWCTVKQIPNLKMFYCLYITRIMKPLISVVLWINSIRIGDIEGFITKLCLEMKRNLSISWRGQLVACHVGGLGSNEDQSICSFWWTKSRWGSSCPKCQYHPVIVPKPRVFCLPLAPYDLNSWQRVWYTVRSHYYLSYRFLIFPSIITFTWASSTSSTDWWLCSRVWSIFITTSSSPYSTAEQPNIGPFTPVLRVSRHVISYVERFVSHSPNLQNRGTVVRVYDLRRQGGPAIPLGNG